MFEKILVCLDDSKLSEQILPYATEQALRFNSRLTAAPTYDCAQQCLHGIGRKNICSDRRYHGEKSPDLGR